MHTNDKQIIQKRLWKPGKEREGGENRSCGTHAGGGPDIQEPADQHRHRSVPHQHGAGAEGPVQEEAAAGPGLPRLPEQQSAGHGDRG